MSLHVSLSFGGGIPPPIIVHCRWGPQRRPHLGQEGGIGVNVLEMADHWHHAAAVPLGKAGGQAITKIHILIHIAQGLLLVTAAATSRGAAFGGERSC